MPYFPVDDKLHSHRKAIRAGAHAIGLWALAGSWSNDQGTDGFIPDYMITRWDPKGKQLAKKLVEVGLWELAERGDEVGWLFHEWTGSEANRRNYTRAEVEQRKREGAERQAKSRQRRASRDWSVTRDNHVTHTEVTPSVARDRSVSHSDPSHPIPVSSKPLTQDVVGSPTKQDQSEVEEKTAPEAAEPRRSARKVFCEEHITANDLDCSVCGIEHGDRAYNGKIRLAKAKRS